MRSGYMKIAAMLLCLCLLSGCGGEMEEPAVTNVQEPVQTEAPHDVAEASPEPWLDYYINSPQMAVETARAEIAKLQELGLFAEKFFLTDKEPDYVDFFEDEMFLKRTDSPFFSVRWYCDSSYYNSWEGDNPYSVVVNLDAKSGKLSMVSIEAAADENAELKYEIPVENGYFNEETGEMELREEFWPYYENFSDLIDDDMTLNRFCDLLNEYWGFGGWTLGGGGALDMSIPLRDISGGTTANYHVALDYEGDEEGKYMYVQISEFPGRIALIFGDDHAKG